MIPQRRPGQSFADHQREMAEWVGCASVAELNRHHDPLHLALCAFFGVESYALMQGRGERLAGHEAHLAALEEVAILTCQRWAIQAGGKLP
jgi:hypothetical protein